MPAPLPPRPDAAYDPVTYRTRAGRFAGALDEVRWGYYRGWLHGQVRRALVRKRWFDVLVHTDTHVLHLRLHDDGTTGHGRVALLDRRTGDRLAWARAEGAPLRTLVVGFMAGAGTDAFLRAPGLDVRLVRPSHGSAWRLVIRGETVRADLVIDTQAAPTPTLTIGEAAPPYAHRPGLTQHHPALRVTGTLSAGGRPIPLHGATAHLSYTNVFLPPFVAARRVVADGFAHGTPVSLALTDGELHGETQETTLWWAGVPHELPPTHLLPDARGWRLLSPCGAVDLRLTITARVDAHTTRRLGFVRHDHAHAFGRIEGTLPTPGGGPIAVRGLRGMVTTSRMFG